MGLRRGENVVSVFMYGTKGILHFRGNIWTGSWKLGRGKCRCRGREVKAVWYDLINNQKWAKEKVAKAEWKSYKPY